MIQEDVFALAINLIVALPYEEVETLGADGLYERFATACRDHDAIVGIRADRMTVSKNGARKGSVGAFF